MQNVILVVHILACVVMTGLVLIQKSEGGGLGMGGGGGGNSLMSGRGTAGALVRTTIIVGGLFFITSLTLTTIANRDNDTRTDVERALGADDEGPITAPADLFDPSAPLLDGQDGGTGNLSVTDPVATGTPAPDTGNPQ